MDGTLYNTHYHEVSIKTLKALKQLQDQGHIVCLATSRTTREMDNLPRAMYNFDFYYKIMEGGSLVLDRKQDVVDVEYVPKEMVHALLKYSRKHNMTFRYSTRDGNYFDRTPREEEYKFYHWLYLNTPEIKAYENEDVLNILIYTYNEQQNEDVKSIAEGCGIVKYPTCYEIKANNRSKASAISKIVEKENIDKVYCFGDGPNDVEMLQLADVGISMGNGCKECKMIADVVIKNVDEDAIYQYLLENNLYKEEE